MEKYQYDPVRLEQLERSIVPMAVYQFIDRRVVTLALSQGFLDLFGYDNRQEAYDIMDHDMYRDAHPDDVARIADAAVAFALGKQDYNVIYRSRRFGEYRIIHAQARHTYTETGTRLAVVWYTDEGPCDTEGGSLRLNQFLSDALRENSLALRSNYDTLTGLPNMTYFFELSEQGGDRIIAQGERPVMLYFDMTGMKDFNRKYGFAAGNELIRSLAKLLVRYFSNENCGRFGQDHFAVYTQASGLEDTLRSIFSSWEAMNGGRSLPLRVGIFQGEAERIPTSLSCDRAKMACDAARGPYYSHFRYFDGSMLSQAELRQYIIDNLDRAISEKWIKVYYQPIIRAANGRVSNEEGLARWIDPVRGLLSPSEFIPILEDAGLLYKLDLFVVEQALEKMQRQAEAGLYVVPGSVNLSRSDFDACDMVSEIRQRVDAANIGREKLIIEITESVVGEDFDFMREQIRRFREERFQVWMDDFGSGYSTLDVLQSIRFDAIKLDMRFLEQFDDGEACRIILTELIKMGMALGVETVMEGVETEAQAEFLKEVGCTKLQGFLYCQAIPLEEIVTRYENGTQIGLENPLESDYYASLGRISLYDLSVIAGEDSHSFRHYFDTLPMAILESDRETIRVVRCNHAYRDFMMQYFHLHASGAELDFGTGLRDAPDFAEAVRQCGEDGKRMIIDGALPDGTTVHTFLRRVNVNPVTGVTACIVVVMDMSAGTAADSGITFARVAQALSSDYFSLYYVDLDTDRFVEYRSRDLRGDMTVERHGDDFFRTSLRDAANMIYPPDLEAITTSFTKETVLGALEEHGAFTMTYRLLIDGEPAYVHMKAVRMHPGSHHIIIGISNVDAQKRHQEVFERMMEERATYARITALSGDYIAIYTVDPETLHYVEYSATGRYAGLGLPKEGDGFFEQSRLESRGTVYSEDLPMFLASFSQEQVMEEIRNNGVFSMSYRLMLGGEPRYVSLKGAMVEEKGGPRLIMGVSDIDAQVEREREAAYQLAQAQSQANRDALTGVKNKHAYIDEEAKLNTRITEHQPLEFAVAVFDINGLKHVNDTQGHQAGDQYLRQGCAIICEIFKHSPVFRVGGDEFAVIAQGQDYENLDSLLARLEAVNLENIAGGGTVVACGMAQFRDDRSVAAVFERADVDMYENKKRLKALGGP